MPPRVVIAPMRSLISPIAVRDLCCPQCHFHRIIARSNLHNRITTFRNLRTRRFASTATAARNDYISASPTPITSVNAPSTVPPNFKELYTSLEQLKNDAAIFVEESGLALALRSLESRDATIRVAVLTGDGKLNTAKRLVRLLIADPLGKEEEWEGALKDSSDEASLLLRYGEEEDPVPANALLKTLIIPSRTLRQHNLEILVSSIPLDDLTLGGDSFEMKYNPLVPELYAQVSTSGRTSPMTYPVHKTLVVGEGLKGFSRVSKLHVNPIAQKSLRMAIELPKSSQFPGGLIETDEASLLDIEAAEQALDKIRQSISNATQWEQGWFKAGIPLLTTWLFEGSTPAKVELKAPVKRLIESIASETASRVTISEEIANAKAKTNTVSDSVRRNIKTATEAWSEDAHTELRDQLDLAFASKHWARLKWYKLFWRSDDVEMILSDIMERRWLVEAEKRAIYLSGRIEGAGLVSLEDEGKLLNSGLMPEIKKLEDPTAETPVLTITKPVGTKQPLPPYQEPYSTQIPVTRSTFSSRTIPSLVALSQSIVLQTGTGISLTTAISALAYISTSTTTLFEAGAVFAFGMVISLRRLQNKWEDAREFWMGEVREEGRKVLKSTEDGIRMVLETGGVGKLDQVGVEDRRRATEAVERVKAVVEKMK